MSPHTGPTRLCATHFRRAPAPCPSLPTHLGYAPVPCHAFPPRAPSTGALPAPAHAMPHHELGGSRRTPRLPLPSLRTKKKRNLGHADDARQCLDGRWLHYAPTGLCAIQPRRGGRPNPHTLGHLCATVPPPSAHALMPHTYLRHRPQVPADSCSPDRAGRAGARRPGWSPVSIRRAVRSNINQDHAVRSLFSSSGGFSGGVCVCRPTPHLHAYPPPHFF